MTPEEDRQQKVLAPPPLIFLAGLALGAILDRLAPIAAHERVPVLALLGADAPLLGRLAIGLALVAFGLLLDVWAVQSFKRAQTTILPWGKPSFLVPTGPYRYTRNPMYVGMALQFVGLAIAIGSVWAFLTMPPTLVVMTYGVIRREEAHLAWRFGQEYEDYRAQVRRWL